MSLDAKNAAEKLREASKQARDALDNLEEAICDAIDADLEVRWAGHSPNTIGMRNTLIIHSIILRQEL